MPRPSTYAGTYFRGLYVIDSFAQENKNGTKRHMLALRCDCGAEFTKPMNSAKKATLLQCDACLIVTPKGVRNHSQYKRWKAMVDRCYNKQSGGYWKYGGRGITVCDAWLGKRTRGELASLDGFIKFLADMGEPPPDTSLDRIDNNGPYAPENCRWADAIQQVNNRRCTANVTYNGETHPVTYWCKKYGLSRYWHMAAIKYGVPPHVALHKTLTQPRVGRWRTFLLSNTIDFPNA